MRSKYLFGWIRPGWAQQNRGRASGGSSNTAGAPGRARGTAGPPCPDPCPDPGDDPGVDSRPESRSGSGELAAATPLSRDRYVDLVRVLSLATVIVGHWLMAVVTLDADGVVQASNALEALSWAGPATWLMQVVPVFFVVGGAAHWYALRRYEPTGGYASFVRRRVGRLLAPTVAFVAAWTTVAILVEASGYERGVLALALRVVAQPLWFLAVYVGLVALAPLMLRLHDRVGVMAPLGMAAAVLLVDVARLGFDVPYVDLANYALCWMAAHQVGFLYADGTLLRAGRRLGWALTGIGFAGLVAMTTVGPYPVSMVGLPGAAFSNMNPPSAALLVQSVMLLGLVLLFRTPVLAWLGRVDRPERWRYVVAANAVAMTTFLWHLTALFLVAAAFVLLGFGLPEPGSVWWWLTRPVWIALLGAMTGLLVAVFRRFELPRPLVRLASGPGGAGGSGRSGGRWADRIAAIGMVLVVLGVLGYAVNGFAILGGQPLRILVVELGALSSGVVLLGGWALVAAATGGRRTRRPYEVPPEREAD